LWWIYYIDLQDGKIIQLTLFLKTQIVTDNYWHIGRKHRAAALPHHDTVSKANKYKHNAVSIIIILT